MIEVDTTFSPIITGLQETIAQAIKFGDLETLKGIINRKMVDLPLGPNDNTALLHAVESKQREIAEYLIKLGADPFLKNKLWESPIEIEAARLFKQFTIGAVPTNTEKPSTKALTPCESICEEINGYAKWGF